MSTTHDLFALIAANDVTRLATLLAEQPALINARSAEGTSPILWAYYTGKTNLLPTLLAANPHLDIYDATVLGNTNRLHTLLAENPSLARAYSSDGFTALHYVAFFNGNVEVASLLLDAGAEVDAVAHNRQQVTPLHSAAAGRNEAIVQFLVSRGANVNARQERNITPLMETAQNGDTALTDYLLAHGADPTLTSDEGQTAADFAMNSGHTDLATKLKY